MSQLSANISSWYGLPAAVFIAVAIFTAVVGGAGLIRRQLLSLAAAGLAWSAHGVLRSGANPAWRLDLAGFVFEFAFGLALFALVYRLLRGPYRQSMPETVRRVLYVFWALALIVTLFSAWPVLAGEGPGRSVTVWHAVSLCLGLLNIALAAQLRRDAPLEDVRALHAFAAAAALAGATQVLVFGIGLLTSVIPRSLHGVRAVAMAASALLIVYAIRRRAQWSLAIFVSPQARAYAPRLLAMLGILFALVAMAPLIRATPSTTAQPLALGLIMLLTVPAVVLLFSDRLSAQLRVFVSKHFLPFRYDYREEWLRLIDTLAMPDPRTPLPERSIKALAQIVSSPAGVLWLRNAEDGPFRCHANWNTRAWLDTPVMADDPALRFMRERQWILDTAELRRDPALYDGLRRPDWLEQFPDALLIVPLISNELLMGFVVLFQSSSAFRLTFEEIDLLRTSGRQVAAHLAQYQADHELAEVRQFEAFNRLTAFVMHDLKNLIAQQSMMVRNAARHKSNPQFFEDAMATIENSVARMNRLLRQLQRGESSGPRQRVRLRDVLAEAIGQSENRRPEPVLVADDPDLYAELNRERFTAILAHLIQNAQDATEPDGKVAVKLGSENGLAMIGIEDNGCGMDSDFIRNRLFRPFDSTKGSKGMGIGAYQARTFVTEAGGTLDVSSAAGKGTRICIRLPLAEPEAAHA